MCLAGDQSTEPAGGVARTGGRQLAGVGPVASDLAGAFAVIGEQPPPTAAVREPGCPGGSVVVPGDGAAGMRDAGACQMHVDGGGLPQRGVGLRGQRALVAAGPAAVRGGAGFFGALLPGPGGGGHRLLIEAFDGNGGAAGELLADLVGERSNQVGGERVIIVERPGPVRHAAIARRMR